MGEKLPPEAAPRISTLLLFDICVFFGEKCRRRPRRVLVPYFQYTKVSFWVTKTAHARQWQDLCRTFKVPGSWNMMKSIQKSLNMYEMGSEMFKYWLQCSEKSDKVEIWKVLRMKLPIVENVPTLRESIFKLPPASQRPSGQKKNWPIFLLFPYIPS